MTRQTFSPPIEDERTAVQCGNKTVFSYKYPSKIFPTIINDYTSSFNIVSGLLNKLAADSSGKSAVSSEATNTARQLRDTLNQDNIFFENNLKAYFLASNDDPCNDSLRYLYTAYIKDMTEKVIEMKQLIAQVSSHQVSNPGSSDHDSLIAVIDTGKGKIVTGSVRANPGQLVIKKDYKNLNSALNNFKVKYSNIAVKNLPLKK